MFGNDLTFAMIKPDAVRAKNAGKIIDMIEKNGFEILRLHKVMLDEDSAQQFYAVHKERPFFNELVEFVCSGPVIIMALRKENAVQEWRNLMGTTNPDQAAEGTVRKAFGTSIQNNAVHGSDSVQTAEDEIMFFFSHELEEGEDNDDDVEFDEEDDEEIEEACSGSCDDCRC